MKRNIKIILMVLIISVVFVLICTFTEVGIDRLVAFNNELQSSTEREIEEGDMLYSDEVLYEDETLICYSDRIMFRFKLNMDNVGYITKIAEGVLNKCENIENLYVMPIPNAILVEDSQMETQYEQYMEALKSELPEKAVLVDSYQSLKTHTYDYIYFKTADSWTTLGAYYGLRDFSEAAGFEVKLLGEYWEYQYNTFQGELSMYEPLDEVDDADLIEDHVHYYILPGTKNRVEETRYDNGVATVSKKPLITPSYRNTGMFISNGYYNAVVEGESTVEKNKGKYLMVICDGAGKIMVPFLKDYYDGVYVVNIMRDEGLINTINDVLTKYNITDVLYIQNVMNMGVNSYSSALNRFCEEKQVWQDDTEKN